MISASDLDPVADYGFNHEGVFEVTNAVTLLGLPPLETWRRNGHVF